MILSSVVESSGVSCVKQLGGQWHHGASLYDVMKYELTTPSVLEWLKWSFLSFFFFFFWGGGGRIGSFDLGLLCPITYRQKCGAPRGCSFTFYIIQVLPRSSKNSQSVKWSRSIFDLIIINYLRVFWIFQNYRMIVRILVQSVGIYFKFTFTFKIDDVYILNQCLTYWYNVIGVYIICIRASFSSFFLQFLGRHTSINACSAWSEWLYWEGFWTAPKSRLINHAL